MSIRDELAGLMYEAGLADDPDSDDLTAAADAILERFDVAERSAPMKRIPPNSMAAYLLNPNRDRAYKPGTRQWSKRADIPADVDRVLDCTGDVVRRLEDGSGWRPLYDDGSDMETNLRTDCLGPFTELRKAVQS